MQDFLKIQLIILNLINKLDDKWTDLVLDGITKYNIRNHNLVHFDFILQPSFLFTSAEGKT